LAQLDALEPSRATGPKASQQLGLDAPSATKTMTLPRGGHLLQH